MSQSYIAIITLTSIELEIFTLFLIIWINSTIKKNKIQKFTESNLGNEKKKQTLYL